MRVLGGRLEGGLSVVVGSGADGNSEHEVKRSGAFLLLLPLLMMLCADGAAIEFMIAMACLLRGLVPRGLAAALGHGRGRQANTHVQSEGQDHM